MDGNKLINKIIKLGDRKYLNIFGMGKTIITEKILAELAEDFELDPNHPGFVFSNWCLRYGIHGFTIKQARYTIKQLKQKGIN